MHLYTKYLDKNQKGRFKIDERNSFVRNTDHFYSRKYLFPTNEAIKLDHLFTPAV